MMSTLHTFFTILESEIFYHSKRIIKEAKVLSGFRRDMEEICDLLGYYAALSSSSVPTFRDNRSVPSSRVKKSKFSWPLKMGLIRCPETSVVDNHSTLRNIEEKHRHEVKVKWSFIERAQKSPLLR
jgi:hypothetical protein